MLQAQRLLVCAALAIAVFMIAPPTSPLLGSPGPETVERTTLVADGVPLPTPTPQIEQRERRTPPKARGILMSGYTAGGSRFESLVEMIERTELNTVVIDIKDESGEISWMPSSPQLQAVGAGRAKMRNPRERLQYLRDRNIWIIGRIVTFQDPVLSETRPDLAVQDTQGGIWRNRKDLGWADPYSSEAWEYNLELAREAADLGFDEIQFDYIRFPTDGARERMWYRHRDLREPAEVVQEFLARARAELEPRGVWLSADVFGLVTLHPGDMGIGQNLERVAREVDYLSPMLYPSHYNKPEYGIPDPERDPYETIYRSLQDALRRTQGTRAQLRPWLQDFSLGVRYTAVEVRAQIRAAEDLGIEEWLLWNAANRYTEDALRPASARRSQ